jgi:D-sedoheptulose 7-phosphate isomerase
MEGILNQLYTRIPELAPLRQSTLQAAKAIINCYTRGGKLLICGNGGSSSQADHIVAELMKSFEAKRPLDSSFRKRIAEFSKIRGKYLAENLEHALPAVSLSAHSALLTAISNDKDADLVFAQQVIGYGCEGDILLAISTSGNSQNIIDACITSRAMNLTVIGTTGKSGGKMKEHCDILLNIPYTGTALIQELQLPLLHSICQIVEEHFYSETD